MRDDTGPLEQLPSLAGSEDFVTLALRTSCRNGAFHFWAWGTARRSGQEGCWAPEWKWQVRESLGPMLRGRGQE